MGLFSSTKSQKRANSVPYEKLPDPRTPTVSIQTQWQRKLLLQDITYLAHFSSFLSSESASRYSRFSFRFFPFLFISFGIYIVGFISDLELQSPPVAKTFNCISDHQTIGLPSSTKTGSNLYVHQDTV